MGDALGSIAQTEYDRFAAQVVAAHDDLPPQLQKIAGFVLDHPQRVALMTIAEMHDEIGVQPSAVIRFSKALGFSGFSEIQKILRNQLNDLIPASYYARLDVQGAQSGQLGRMAALAEASLGNLPDPAQIEALARRMAGARMIHVVGMRRAYGIAAYASYLLAGFDAPVHQITATGAMTAGDIHLMNADDVLLAISFPNYRAQTLDVARAASGIGVYVVALTDSAVSPIAKCADEVVIADQATDAGFRSVVGSMVTVQALAMEYGRVRA